MALINYEDLKTPDCKAREWRDAELERTDKFFMISDYPDLKKSDLKVYRQALRDWPSTEDFPDTRPTL